MFVGAHKRKKGIFALFLPSLRPRTAKSGEKDVFSLFFLYVSPTYIIRSKRCFFYTGQDVEYRLHSPVIAIHQPSIAEANNTRYMSDSLGTSWLSRERAAVSTQQKHSDCTAISMLLRC